MTLIQLKHYLVSRNVVTLNELVSAFSSDSKTIEAMMQHWTDSGHVDRQLACDACQGCLTACHTYVWKND